MATDVKQREITALLLRICQSIVEIHAALVDIRREMEVSTASDIDTSIDALTKTIDAMLEDMKQVVRG